MIKTKKTSLIILKVITKYKTKINSRNYHPRSISHVIQISYHKLKSVKGYLDIKMKKHKLLMIVYYNYHNVQISIINI